MRIRRSGWIVRIVLGGKRESAARPAPLAVERHLVRIGLPGLEPRDRHDRVVMALGAERPLATTEHLDLAGRVGLDPDGRAANRPGSAPSARGSARPWVLIGFAHELGEQLPHASAPGRGALACGAAARRAGCARLPRARRPEPASRAWPATSPTSARATSAHGPHRAVVEDRRRDAVAARAEARLRDRLGREPLDRRRLERSRARERVHQRRERGRVLERGLRVDLAHLDGAEPRMRAHVPPDAGVVVEVPRGTHRPHRLSVLVPARRTTRGTPRRG